MNEWILFVRAGRTSIVINCLPHAIGRTRPHGFSVSRHVT
jgi:hypothetical protein